MAARHLLPARSGSVARGWHWALLGAVLGGAIALMAFAPARWLADGLAGWSHGQLRLANPRGTVWNGSASLVLSSGGTGAESISLPGQIGWKLKPWWTGVAASLDIPCCAAQPLQLMAMPRADGVRVDWQDGTSRWPAALLSGLGAPWNTLKPEGTLDLSTQGWSMQWDGPKLAMAGKATLDATDISSSLSTLRPMGSYRMTLDGGPAPTLILTTREGSLQLSGSGRWNGRGFRFDGEASAAEGREEALANLLNIIGRRNGARSLITLG